MATFALCQKLRFHQRGFWSAKCQQQTYPCGISWFTSAGPPETYLRRISLSQRRRASAMQAPQLCTAPTSTGTTASPTAKTTGSNNLFIALSIGFWGAMTSAASVSRGIESNGNRGYSLRAAKPLNGGLQGGAWTAGAEHLEDVASKSGYRERNRRFGLHAMNTIVVRC